MDVFKTIAEMQAYSQGQKGQGHLIAVVPTMGYLHEGHMSLVAEARRHAEIVVVTIFVNPTQFGPNEDLAAYPRDWEHDVRLCRRHDVDAIFAPEPEEMYPADSSTWVIEEKLSRGLCARTRPTHFRGVTTVVAKLFNAVLPDVAVFGQKDAQQVLVLDRMVRDLNFPIEMVIAPIVREKDGLAMSSRNKYLNAAEREQAPVIYRTLKEIQARMKADPTCDPSGLQKEMVGMIEAVGGQVDYVEILDATTLEAPTAGTEELLIAAAVYFGTTRLLDNVMVEIKPVGDAN